jgi:hypothetical protein
VPAEVRSMASFADSEAENFLFHVELSAGSEAMLSGLSLMVDGKHAPMAKVYPCQAW